MKRFLKIASLGVLLVLLGWMAVAQFWEVVSMSENMYWSLGPLGLRSEPAVHMDIRIFNNHTGKEMDDHQWHVGLERVSTPAGRILPNRLWEYFAWPRWIWGGLGPSILLPWWLIVGTWAAVTLVIWRPKRRQRVGFPVEVTAEPGIIKA